jgi:hypothetical protein
VALADDIAALIVTPAVGGTSFLTDQAVLHAAAKSHETRVTAAQAAAAAAVKTVNGTAPDGSGNVAVAGGTATTDAGALTTGTLADARLSTATTTALGKAGTAVQPAGLTKAAVGLGNVDNTADVNKPVSTAQTAAFVGTADARLTNSRTPTAHAATHTTGGSDALTAANVGAEPTITRTGGVTGWVPTLQAGGTLALAAPAGGGAAAATTTTQGIVKLAGALGGTADLPTVPGLASKADLVSGVVPSAQLPPLNFGTGLSYDAPSSTLSATAAGFASTFTAATLDGGASDQTTAQALAASGFRIVLLNTAATGAANFNTTTALYTVPSTGIYMISARVRPTGGFTANQPIGLGVDTASADSPNFKWTSFGSSSGTPRTSVDYARTDNFTAGAQLRLFMYSETGAINIYRASMSIVRIA